MSNVIDQPHDLQENVGFHSIRLGAIIFCLHTHTASLSGEASAPHAICASWGQGMLKVFQPPDPCVTWCEDALPPHQHPTSPPHCLELD